MYLIYTDETGTNNHPNVIFSMYGGLVVHESSVLKFEMQIIEIVQEFYTRTYNAIHPYP